MPIKQLLRVRRRHPRQRAAAAAAAALALACGAAAGAPAQTAAAPLTPELVAGICRQMRVIPALKDQEIALGKLVGPDGQPTAPDTTATLSWDERGVTVKFDCADTNIMAAKRHREALLGSGPKIPAIWRVSALRNQDDMVAVFLDAGRQRNPAIEAWMMMCANPAGSIYDECGPLSFENSPTSCVPISGNCRWWGITEESVQVETNARGWRARMLIAWPVLGGRPNHGEVWGFNLERGLAPEKKFQYLAPTGDSCYNLDRWAVVQFLERPLAGDPAALAELFRELHVTAVPRGAPGVALPALPAINGGASKLATTAEVRWDDRGLTIVFNCAAPALKAEKRPRDDTRIQLDDAVEVFLDPGNHRQPQASNWVHVIVSAAGTELDQRGPMVWDAGGGYSPRIGLQPSLPCGGNAAWNLPGLKTSVARDPSGWRAELFLPWDGLGARPRPGEIWGFNLARSNYPEREYQSLASLLSSLHFIERWGNLLFLDQPLDLPPEPAARPTPAKPTGANLVFNGAFDRGLEGWIGTGPGGAVKFQKTDEHWYDGHMLFAPTRTNVICLQGFSWTSLSSPLFPLDPAGRYRLSVDLRALDWNVKIFVDGYAWKPGVTPHAGTPQPQELVRVWRSRPLSCSRMPIRTLREQNFANPPIGDWIIGQLDFPAPGASRYEQRPWSAVRFARVSFGVQLGGGNWDNGWIFLDNVAVQRLE